MKQLIVGLSLFAVACSSATPTVPTASGGSGQAIIQATGNPGQGPEATQPPTPPAPGANATVPQFTLSGPRDPLNCFTAGTSPMQWVLNVTDAGPSALRFVAVAHQDDTPGCGATVKNPRSRLDISGVTDYTPHSSGQTTLTFDPQMYNCGRVQVDVSIFDASGKEILIVGVVINYGSVCQPVAPSCLASVSNPTGPGLYSFSVLNPVAGATYTWSVPGGTPATGTGTSFQTTFSASGTYTVQPSGPSGPLASSCVTVVNVTAPSCLASATNPTGAGLYNYSVANPVAGTTYTWSAPGGTPATGTGTSFQTTFSASGTYTVQPSSPSGPLASSCVTAVNVTAPSCVASANNPPSGSSGSYSFSIQNPTAGALYQWSVTPLTGSNPVSGTGTSFTSVFALPAPGTTASYQITATTPAVPAPISYSCPVVTVNNPVGPTLSCAPPTQSVLLGQPVSFTGTVANWPTTLPPPTLTWAATSGSPTSGTTTGVTGTFQTAFTSGTGNSVTVTTPVGTTGTTLTATCQVTHPALALACTPATQNAPLGQLVSFTGTLTGLPASAPAPTLNWQAPTGTPATGSTTGAVGTFSTAFASGLSNTVQVTSTLLGPAGTPLTASCVVNTQINQACVGFAATVTPLTPAVAQVDITVPPNAFGIVEIESWRLNVPLVGWNLFDAKSLGTITQNASTTINTAVPRKVEVWCNPVTAPRIRLLCDSPSTGNVCPN